MVTVSVIGVLIAFGLPSLQSVLLNQRIKTTASDFHTALLLARSEAIKRGSDISIDGNTNGWDIKSGTTVLQTKDDLDASITVECNTDADTAAETCPASITFKRTGRLDPANIPFEIRFFISGNPSVFTRCVSISLSGRPRVLIDSDNNPANGC
jgi:type IV fimbrial biogenesis protein FimT